MERGQGLSFADRVRVREVPETSGKRLAGRIGGPQAQGRIDRRLDGAALLREHDRRASGRVLAERLVDPRLPVDLARRQFGPGNKGMGLWSGKRRSACPILSTRSMQQATRPRQAVRCLRMDCRRPLFLIHQATTQERRC